MAESRYQGVGRAVLQLPDGQQVPYLRRRFCPSPAILPQAGAVTVAARDRMDLIAARTLGDPLLAWRVADINAAMDPFALVTAPGRQLVVPSRQP